MSVIKAYLALHVLDPEPIFCFRKGSYLTYVLVRSEREVFLRVGLDAQNYSGHSFRVENGGAACGVEGSLRWMEQFHIFVVCAGPVAAVASTVFNTFSGILPALTSLAYRSMS